MTKFNLELCQVLLKRTRSIDATVDILVENFNCPDAKSDARIKLCKDICKQIEKGRLVV